MLTLGLAVPWASYGYAAPPFGGREVIGNPSIWALSVLVVLAPAVARRAPAAGPVRWAAALAGTAAVLAMLVLMLPLLAGHVSIRKLTDLDRQPVAHPVNLVAPLLVLAGAALLAGTAAWAGRAQPLATVRIAVFRAVSGAAGVLAVVNLFILMSHMNGADVTVTSALNPVVFPEDQRLRPWTYVVATVAFIGVVMDMVTGPARSSRPFLRRSVRLVVLLSYAVILGEGAAFLYWIQPAFVPWLAVAPAALLAVAVAATDLASGREASLPLN